MQLHAASRQAGRQAGSAQRAAAQVNLLGTQVPTTALVAGQSVVLSSTERYIPISQG